MAKEFEEKVISYLEGCLSREEEKNLLSRIVESDTALSEFRNVVTNWERGTVPDNCSMAMAENIVRKVNYARRKKRRKSFVAAASVVLAAAAISCIIIFSPGVRENKTGRTIVAESGTKVHYVLPDSTRVWLNAGSTLSYDSSFNRKDRVVNLDGEAYFEVKSDPSRTFIVETSKCSYQVLGTKFNVYAYSQEDFCQTVLLEGSLKALSGDNMILISPGEGVSCSEGSFHKEKVNADQFISWMNGFITYDEITLPVLLHRLSRFYGVEIELDTDICSNEKIMVSFSEQESLPVILNSISKMLPVKIISDKNGYIVKSK